jgi:hypothetical protein
LYLLVISIKMENVREDLTYLVIRKLVQVFDNVHDFSKYGEEGGEGKGGKRRRKGLDLFGHPEIGSRA